MTASKDQIEAANGFVVCTIWMHAKTYAGSFAYENYTKLADAVAAYHNPGSSFKAHGIFPARDGLPIGGPLDMKVIDAVTPGEKRSYGLREWCPITPENMQLRERARESVEPSL